MSKYDFAPITQLSPIDAHGMILSQIKDHSIVLECGCATGCMTRYLKEKKHCLVDIIEIDEGAFHQAWPYAHDGYCGSLDDAKWYVYFMNRMGNQYDYVLFADVLEHLKDPLYTLTRAAELLKDDGKVIFSIPNICHNDILIRMFYNDFRYTPLGLLDDTHIHFWGSNQLPKFCHDAKLKIEKVEGVFAGTGTTEQRYPDSAKIDEDLIRAISKRQYGEVYQYVVTCRKTSLKEKIDNESAI